jgi:hypothetical protein
MKWYSSSKFFILIIIYFNYYFYFKLIYFEKSEKQFLNYKNKITNFKLLHLKKLNGLEKGRGFYLMIIIYNVD